METVETDLLILGAGGAGLCAALHAADRAPGVTVTVVVKGLLGRAGCTRMVQGGYNAVLTPPRLHRGPLPRHAERWGSHFRRDFPESDPRWLVNVLVQAKGREVRVWTEPVRLTRVRPGAPEPQMAAVEIGD
jgi:succinate dehydrogenase/fumarate reductase flavoprotein subunit